jgi:hypothetical protein
VPKENTFFLDFSLAMVDGYGMLRVSPARENPKAKRIDMDDYGNMMVHGFNGEPVRIVRGEFGPSWWVGGIDSYLAGPFASESDARRWAEDPAERVWDSEEEASGRWVNDPESFA